MWLGLIIGTLCLIGLIHAVASKPRWYGPWGYAHGHGCHGSYGCAPSWGPRRMLWGVLSRLETTPGQEKAIVQALDELRATLGGLRSSVRGARGKFARSVSAASFDESSWTEAERDLETSGREASGAVQAALKKIHATLDDRQRQRLSSMIDAGFWHGCC